MRDVYVIGDSWAAGYNDELHLDNHGWAQELGIPDTQILAVSGSRAQEWVEDIAYRAKLESIRRGATVICSLGGNDCFRAMADGVITEDEKVSLWDTMFEISSILLAKDCHVYYIAYADPFRGTVYPVHKSLIWLNGLIRAIASLHQSGVIWLYDKLADDDFLPLEEVKRRNAIHPNVKGYSKIASIVKGLL